MLRGTSGRIAGLKIPCGPRIGTRWPSNSRPAARIARGKTSPWSSNCFSRNSKAAARPRASRSGLATEHRLVMPVQELGVGLIQTPGRQHHEMLAMVLVVVTAILELLLDPRAHFDTALRRHRDVSTVEEDMQVGPQQQSVVD